MTLYTLVQTSHAWSPDTHSSPTPRTPAYWLPTPGCNGCIELAGSRVPHLTYYSIATNRRLPYYLDHSTTMAQPTSLLPYYLQLPYSFVCPTATLALDFLLPNNT